MAPAAVDAPGVRLLLDELYDPAIARQLRRRGHDVIAAVEEPSLRATPDRELLRQAHIDGRVLVSDNVRDFLRLHSDFLANGESHSGLVLTSSRRFPRSTSTGRLVKALEAFLAAETLATEDCLFWL